MWAVVDGLGEDLVKEQAQSLWSISMQFVGQELWICGNPALDLMDACSDAQGQSVQKDGVEQD